MMIVYPGSKINLGLRILSRRNDGFHNIETVFCPIRFSDILEAVVIGEGADQLSVSGIPIPGAMEDNLCWKALRILRSSFTFPAISARLHKLIPPGSGLGGGSADAAAMLMMVNRLAGLGLDQKILGKLAGRLGTDCAFFIRNRPVLATGKGDRFRNVRLPGGWKILLVIPPDQVSTAWAYSAIGILRPEGEHPSEAIGRPVKEWKALMINDFERPVFNQFPAIARIREELYAMGAVFASMSGSGSAVYGLFEEMPEVSGRFTGCLLYSGRLGD